MAKYPKKFMYTFGETEHAYAKIKRILKALSPEARETWLKCYARDLYDGSLREDIFGIAQEKPFTPVAATGENVIPFPRRP